MTLTRRQFALLFGGSVAASSLVPWLLKRSRAQAPMGPVRFLGVRTPHGVHRDYWIPKNGDGSDPRTPDEALSGLTFDYENSILQPLMPWREQITVLDGLDSQCTKEATRGSVRNSHGHNEQGTMLTGAQPPADRETGYFDNHASLDFFFHSRIPSPALLTASVDNAGTWKCMSYDDSGNPRTPVRSPDRIFGEAFPADFMPPDPGEPMVDYVPGERQILAQVDAELARLESRLTNEEQVKLAAHREAIARLVPEETGVTLGACTTSGSELPGVDGRITDYNGVRTVTRAHARVIAQAFACGRSRSATLQILNDNPNWYSDVPEVRDSPSLYRYPNRMTFRFHENLVHDFWAPENRAELLNGYCMGQRWAAGNFAIVLEELSMMVDPQDPTGGSILDNTVIFWHNEFGHDGHDNQHTMHPAVIAGGGGRTLKLGRYLRLRDIDTGNVNGGERVPHNRLLTSLCHAMGLTDVNYYGDRDLSDRPEYQGPLAPLMA